MILTVSTNNPTGRASADAKSPRIPGPVRRPSAADERCASLQSQSLLPDARFLCSVWGVWFVTHLYVRSFCVRLAHASLCVYDCSSIVVTSTHRRPSNAELRPPPPVSTPSLNESLAAKKLEKYDKELEQEARGSAVCSCCVPVCVCLCVIP